MKKEILEYPKEKEILQQKSEPIAEINDEIKELAQDLIDTLKETKTGVGISAVQIGVLKTMCVIKYNNKIYVMINPKITRTRGTKKFKEGCLSVPEVYTEAERAEKVWCEYTDLDGNIQETSQGGLFSAIIQHELDHFEGTCKVFEEKDTQDKMQEAMKEMYAKQGMDMNEGVPVKTSITGATRK